MCQSEASVLTRLLLRVALGATTSRGATGHLRMALLAVGAVTFQVRSQDSVHWTRKSRSASRFAPLQMGGEGAVGCSVPVCVAAPEACL